MKVFAIGDLHLSSSGEKPMDVFGPAWADHARKLEENWRLAVTEEDLVLLPGDLSWAMRLHDAVPDLQFIESLPGTKFFISGNHDYWFSGPAKVRAVLGPSTRLIRFDAAVHRGVGICGVRGWVWPGHPDYKPERDERHWQRAIARLELSVKALSRLTWEVAAAMFHFPPLDAGRTTELCNMIRDAGVRCAVYAHIHGEAAAAAFEGERDGVLYRCVSADRLGFKPLLLFEHPGA